MSKNQINRLSVLVTSIALAAGFTACSTGSDETATTPAQTTTPLFSLVHPESGKVLSVAYSRTGGYSFSTKVVDKYLGGEVKQVSAQGIGDILGGGGEGEGAPASGAPVFTANAPGGPFDANVDTGSPSMEDYGANISLPNPAATSFSVSPFFSASSCDLSGLCYFIGAFACEAAGQAGGQEGAAAVCGSAEINAAVNECLAHVNEFQSEIPAEFQPFMCLLVDLFACMGEAAMSSLQSGGEPDMEQLMETECSGELAAIIAVGIALGGDMDEGGDQ